MKFFWYIKQLFPLAYVSTYTEKGKRRLTVWRMWLGRCSNIRTFILETKKEMIWISLGRWTCKGGLFLFWERVLYKGWIWTPFVKVSKRYPSWLGFWGR